MGEEVVEDKSYERYIGYMARFRSLTRYLGYSSDVGEAFRPLVHPAVVTSAYAVSWAYVGVDVYKHAHHEYLRPGSTKDSVTRVAVFQGTFQTIATMALPALTVHQSVRLGKVLFRRTPGIIGRWGPTLLGLAVVPFLPFMYDHPTERALQFTFDRMWPQPNQKQ